MNECEELVQKIASQNLPAGEVVVTLEDFFIGNDDRGSIGCNLGDDQPEISEFYDTLLEIRSKPEVQDVLVRIYDSDTSGWPYSDTVYVLTSKALEDVRKWVAELKPDEIYAEWMYGPPPKAPKLGAGIKPYSVWWD